MDGPRALAYWKAVAMVPVDRRLALAELEDLFASGSAPDAPEGFHRGRLVATTLGHGLDVVPESMARLWMPWRGKLLDPAASEGRNVFSSRGRFVARLLWPRYRSIARLDNGRDTAFRFVTSVGGSAGSSAPSVLRLDYDVPDNPAWPIRRVLDELVEVEGGLLLGHALVRLGGRWRRAAWFSLQP